MELRLDLRPAGRPTTWRRPSTTARLRDLPRSRGVDPSTSSRPWPRRSPTRSWRASRPTRSRSGSGSRGPLGGPCGPRASRSSAAASPDPQPRRARTRAGLRRATERAARALRTARRCARLAAPAPRPLLEVGRARPEGNADRDRGPVPEDVQVTVRRVRTAPGRVERVLPVDLLAVDRGDDVAVLDAGLGGGAVRDDRRSGARRCCSPVRRCRPAACPS